MDVIDMGAFHPELHIKEEKMSVIPDVMGETEFFGRNEDQLLSSVPEGALKVEAKEEIPDVKDEVKIEITVEDQAVGHQDMFVPCSQKLVKQEDEEEETTPEDHELPSPSHTVNPFLQNAQECGSCLYSDCTGCFKATGSLKNECSDYAGSCYERCVNNTKESSCNQMQMNIPVEEFEPKVGTFSSDFISSIPSYRNKPLKMDPIVKLSRLELSPFGVKHLDKSKTETDICRLQQGKSHIKTDNISDSKGASVTEFPAVQGVIVHPSCLNSLNDSGSKTNSFSQHKNEHSTQRTANIDHITKLSKGLLLKQKLKHHASGSSSTKMPKHEIVSHMPRSSKLKNKIETVGSTVKHPRRLSSNYKLRKCMCDCNTSHSVEGKTNIHKPHRSRWRAQTDESNSVSIGNMVKESNRLLSNFKLKQRLSENNSAKVAEDKTDVRSQASHEAEQTKFTCMPKSNIRNIQKRMQHSRAHVDDTPYHCDRCNKQYATSHGLRDHYMFHTGARPFVCKVCAKMFPTLIQLVKHSQTHMREQTYECQLCDKKFRFLISLKRHILFHTGERPFECILCNKRFFTVLHLKNHIHIHTGEKPYVCRLCWMGFSSLASLRKHRFHHARGQPYSCKFCSTQFRRYRLYIRHIETHKIIKYECSECHQVFSSLTLIKKHVTTHSAVRPYNCTLCSSAFSNSTSLILHYQSHRKFGHRGLTFTR